MILWLHLINLFEIVSLNFQNANESIIKSMWSNLANLEIIVNIIYL